MKFSGKWRLLFLAAGLTISVLTLAPYGCWAEPTPPKNVISMETASRIAVKTQPGKLTVKELEFENKIWIYSFEILGGDNKIHEVNIDALTGRIVAQEIETPEKEVQEEKEDLAATGAPAPGGYKILKKVHLKGDGGWDLLTVDAGNRRLYITHDNKVQALDADTLKVVGTIENVQRPHGVALVPGLNKGFITSGDPGSVVAFDLKTLKRLSEIPASKDADVILYDDATKRIYTFNGDSGNSTVIDPGAEKAVKSIDLGGSPEAAAADGKGNIFDNLADKSMVVKIKTKSLKIVSRWPTAPGVSPTGMAMDADHHRLFIGCRNKLLVVMDSKNGRVVKTLPIGEHVDSTAFDPKSGMIFNSCGDGTLSVIHEDSPNQYHVVENAATEPGARTMAFDAKTGHVFLDTAQTMPVTPTADNPRPRRKPVPGTFKVLEVGK